jgi:hypothetical protein
MAGGGGQGFKEKGGRRRRQQCGVEVVEISPRLSIVREIRENQSLERIGNRRREISTCKIIEEPRRQKSPNVIFEESRRRFKRKKTCRNSRTGRVD